MAKIIETESPEGTAIWIKEEPIFDEEEGEDEVKDVKEEDALDISEHVCCTCNATFDTEAQLRNHITVNHSSRTGDAHQKERLSENISRKEPENETSETMTCEPEVATFVSCTVTDSLNTLKKRNELHQKMPENSQKGSIPFLSQKLPTNKNKKALALEKLAAAQADASKRFTCPHCDFRTELHDKLAEHIVEKHKKEPSYKCSLCDFSSINLVDVDHHMLDSHTNERPYACQYCDFTSKLTSALRMHIAAAHSTVKKEQCPYCDYSTTLANNLRTHVQSKHTGEKKFACPHCNYGTMTSTRLKNHIMAKHTKEKPLSCPFCPYSAVQTSNLKNHITSKHGNMQNV